MFVISLDPMFKMRNFLQKLSLLATHTKIINLNCPNVQIAIQNSKLYGMNKSDDEINMLTVIIRSRSSGPLSCFHFVIAAVEISEPACDVRCGAAFNNLEKFTFYYSRKENIKNTYIYRKPERVKHSFD